MTHIPANGINLCFDSFGDHDAQVILLISGLGTQMIRWTTLFCEELASRGYRVIRFDNRDSGRSTHFLDSRAPDLVALISAATGGMPINVPYTLHDMAADAIGLLDALSIERVHVVGRSMGGMIAQPIASEYTGRVSSLTSIMSSTGNPRLPSPSPDVMEIMTRRAPSPYEDESGFLEQSLAFARRIASPGYAFDEASHRALILEEIERGYDPSGFARQIAAIAATGDLRPRLARVVVPTLVIHGTDDPLILPRCGQDIAASIAGAQLMLINGMGHDLPSELYGKVADAIHLTALRGSYPSRP